MPVIFSSALFVGMNALTSIRPDRMSWLLMSHGFNVLWRRHRYRHVWVWAFIVAAFGGVASEAIATPPLPGRDQPAPVLTSNVLEPAPFQISQATAPSPTLRVGDSGDAVTKLQENLAALGYYDGPVTGYFGEQTEQAVIEFQTSNGLTADGIVGTGTLAALVNARTPTATTYVEATPGNVREGTRGELVVALQERLSNLGYYTGGIDGIFGKATTQAVLAFQENNGLTADGVVGPATEQALRSASAVSAASPAPAPAPSSSSTPTPSSSPSPSVLRLGSTGRDVIVLQSQLQALGYYAGSIDGSFGQSTEDAVVRFQETAGLVADGLVGPQTTYLLDEQFFALRSAPPINPTVVPTTTPPAATAQPSPAPVPSVSNPTTVAPAPTPTFPGTSPQSTSSTPPIPSTAVVVPTVPSAAVSVPTTPTVTIPTPAPPPSAVVVPSPSPVTQAPSLPTATQVSTQGTESVREVQQELQKQGLYSGPINGVMTPELEQAIREAQEEHGLSPNDIVR